MSATGHECGGDAAAYVLGALEPAEAEAFAHHVAECVVCRDEVAALRQVVDALPMAAPQYAVPAGLRRRVMKSVRAEAASGPARARRPWPAWLSLRLTPALAGGFAVVLAAAIAGVLLITTGGSSGTRVIQAKVGEAEMRVSGTRGELIVRHLPPTPAGQIYQVWLRRGQGAPQPTSTLFGVTRRGTGEIGLPGSLHGIDQVLVTREPDGGTLVPTTPVVVDVQLT